MMKRNLRCGAIVLGSLLSLSGVVWAGRPLAIDDADPVDPGHFEFEVGSTYEHDADCKHWDVPFGLTYGLVPGVEVGAGFGGQFEERTDYLADTGTDECIREDSVGDLIIGAKWQFTKSCPLGARHALAPSVKVPTADDETGLGSGMTDYDLTWIASRSIGEKAGAHLNLGYSWIGGPNDDVLHYGLALDYQIVDKVQWVGEVFAERELADGEDTVAQYNTGFRWVPIEGLSLDLAGGTRICGKAPDYTGTLGLTWAFGLTDNQSQ